MKLAFIVSGKSAFTLPGGLGAYAYNTCRIVAKLGYRVFLISYSDRDETVAKEFGTLVHIRTPFNRFASLGVFLITPYLVKRMVEIVDREGPDEVVVFGAGVWGLAGNRLKERMSGEGIPVTALAGYFTTYRHEYEGQVKGAPARDYGIWASLLVRMLTAIAKLTFVPLEHRMLCGLDRIVVHYASTQRILTEEIACLVPGAVKKIPYYVDIYSRDSDVAVVGRPADTPRISIICRQDPRKGINSFLHAVRRLKEKELDFSCVVAGTGFFYEHNRRLARKLGVDDRVTFPGFVESADKLLEDTDIFVLPSVEEGSGAIALMEAMKKGVAIVTTRCDGIPEDFDHGETGLLVEPGDSRDLAQALERLITDRILRETLARNVRKDYQCRFTFEKMRLGVKEVLDSLPR